MDRTVPPASSTDRPDDASQPISTEAIRMQLERILASRDGGGIWVISAIGGDERLVARRSRRPRFSPDWRTTRVFLPQPQQWNPGQQDLCCRFYRWATAAVAAGICLCCVSDMVAGREILTCCLHRILLSQTASGQVSKEVGVQSLHASCFFLGQRSKLLLTSAF
jgi:hypothetical protein